MATRPECTATPLANTGSGTGPNSANSLLTDGQDPDQGSSPFNSPAALAMIIIVCIGGGLLLLRWYRESPTIPPGPPVKPGEGAFIKLDSSQLPESLMQPPGPPIKPSEDAFIKLDSSQLPESLMQPPGPPTIPPGPPIKPSEDAFSKWDRSTDLPPGDVPPPDGDLPAVQ